ncbi:nucleotidyltransferase domain-containing protein [Hydrogenimonas sp. SS33]|uniref:nucleotidyltransferase family protein n=1 Tax=Hydrogenimonas leucolamina TaxID=2954236 RepID=UPI00336C2C58
MTKKEILEYLQQRYPVLQERYGVTAIGFFGSYARDEATEKSDIDIFVEMPPKLSSLVAVKEMIEKDLDKPVDLVRLWDRMNPYLKRRIEREGIRVLR